MFGVLNLHSLPWLLFSGAMVRGMGEASFDELLPWLMSTLTSETSSVDRSGAAQVPAGSGFMPDPHLSEFTIHQKTQKPFTEYYLQKNPLNVSNVRHIYQNRFIEFHTPMHSRISCPPSTSDSFIFAKYSVYLINMHSNGSIWITKLSETIPFCLIPFLT